MRVGSNILLVAAVLRSAAPTSHDAQSQWDAEAVWEMYFPSNSTCTDLSTALHARVYVRGECAHVGQNAYVKAACAGGVPSLIEHNTSDCSDVGSERANPDQCSANFTKLHCTRPTGLTGEWFYRVEGFETDSSGDAVDCYSAAFRLASKSGECVEKFLGSGIYERVTCRDGRGFDVEPDCSAGCTGCGETIGNGFVNSVTCPFRDPLTQPKPPPNSGGCASWDKASSINTGIIEPCSDSDTNPACGEDSCAAESAWPAGCTECKTSHTTATDAVVSLATNGTLTDTECEPIKTAADEYAACMKTAGCSAEYACDVDVGGSLPDVITAVCPSLESYQPPDLPSQLSSCPSLLGEGRGSVLFAVLAMVVPPLARHKL